MCFIIQYVCGGRSIPSKSIHNRQTVYTISLQITERERIFMIIFIIIITIFNLQYVMTL